MDDYLPAEVSVNPVPYISLIGLDAVNNKIHTAIWNCFAINRAADRPVLYYKLINSDHKFPKSKNRKSYDRYVPAGIIKKKWLYKHLFEIPSVVAIFEQIDWTRLQIDCVRQGLVERINFIKNDLTGRQIKIVLILLQTDPIPVNDDSIYKEQATKLCEECDISPKSLFIIPINDESSIPGYVLRIEIVINELAKNHYAAKAKLVKSHKDHLNKSLQNYLFVRHEFKLGFYHEIRQIYNFSLGHYKNAYANLMEIRMTPQNISEIKNVASLLNYKVIRLYFYVNSPMDAITYFRKHIDIFQNKFISEEIDFEHYSWLAKQFFMFAELFDMAINMFHLSPSTTQNPGTYYFESAMYTIKRRQAARRRQIPLQNQDEINFINEILDKQHSVEFIGQLPWMSTTIDPYSHQNISDELGYKVLQYAEQLSDLTPFLISLYINVLNQIKKFKKPRFMRYIMFLIGEEYYQMANFNDALNYFCNILTFYREEKWKLLHGRICTLALNSAFQSIDFHNFIKCGFELISNNLMITDEERSSLVDLILAYLNLEYRPMVGQTTTPDDEWQTKLNEMNQLDSHNEIFINVDPEINFFKCKVSFSSKQYTIEDDIFINVYVFNRLSIDLNKINFQIKFENSILDENCVLVNDVQSNEPQTLKANALNVFRFRLKPLCKILENFVKKIKIIEVSLLIQTKVPIRFQWPIVQNTMFIPIKEINQDAVRFNDKIDEQTSADILELNSNLDIQVNHSTDFYVNENAPIELRISSKEKHPISNIRLSAKIFANPDELDPSHKWFIINEKNGGDILEQIEDNHLILNNLESQSSFFTEIILNILSVGYKILYLNFTYDLMLLCNDEDQQQFRTITTTKTYSSTIQILEPFLFRSSISNYANSETANIRVDEPFRLNIQLKPNDESSAIKIHGIEPRFENTLNILSKKSVELPVILSRNSQMDEIYLMTCSVESPLYSLGQWMIKWSRINCEEHQNLEKIRKKRIQSETLFTLPSVMISPSLIFVELFLPDKVYARNPFMAKYKIHSRLDMDVIIEIVMGSAEYFMIAGNRQVKINLQSKLSTEQLFIFFPLTCGQLVLPKIDITVQPMVQQQSHHQYQNPIKIDYVNQMVASTIFVLPKLRTTINF